MVVDLIKRQYVGTMRAFDGSLFQVAWHFADEGAPVLPYETPFRSEKPDSWRVDTGWVGEVYNRNPPYAPGGIPARVCTDCNCGDPTWWESGWPAGTPPVVLAPDGWPTCCDGGPPVGVTSVGLALPAEFVVTGSPVTAIGTLTGDWASEAANTFLAAPSGAAGRPAFRLLVGADLAGLVSISLVAPAEFNVTGSPVSPSGTLHLSWANEVANVVLAGPSSGGAATPGFRALVAADLPNLDASKTTSGVFAVARLGTGTPSSANYLRGDGTWSAIAAGTVTSVDLTMPSIFGVSGGPITSSGTFTVTLTTEAANTVLAGPTSGGAVTPTFRALVAADIPSLDASKTTTGTFATAQIPNLAGSKITSGGLNASFVDTGTLPLAVIPVLTSAQLPAGTATVVKDHITQTTTASYATLWTRTSANGLHGVGRLRNNGTGSMNYRWTVTDMWTGVATAGLDQTLGASSSVLWSFDNASPTGFPATVVQPFTTLLLEIKTAAATPAQSVEIYASTIG